MLVEPAYRTYKALHADAIDGDAAQRVLLTHWIVYSAFRVTDLFIGNNIPLYGLVKCIAIVWLRTTGPVKLYRSTIGPFLDRWAPVVDPWMLRYDGVVDHINDVYTGLVTNNYHVSADENYNDDDDNNSDVVENVDNTDAADVTEDVGDASVAKR